MQILAITKDEILLSSSCCQRISKLGQLIIYKGSYDQFEVISSIDSNSPVLLILDDDALRPNSLKILKSIKQFSNKNVIIFLTSDSSIDLFREVSSNRVYYYGIKPISDDEILDLIGSVSTKNKSNKIFSNKMKTVLKKTFQYFLCFS